MVPPPVGVAAVMTSLPSRGAWIEICAYLNAPTHSESLPSRGAWIEIPVSGKPYSSPVSLPSRGAWIEIHGIHHIKRIAVVAPLAGSVD